MRRVSAFLFCLLIVGCVQAVPYPEGYRMTRYLAPVPDGVPGAKTLRVNAAYDMHKTGTAVFIDVIGSGHFLTKGIENEWLVVYPRLSVPGSYWLPDVGRGALTAKQKHYFRAALAGITGNDKTRSLVFFCLKDCWMSWNATKRAQAMGYQNVHWYPAGTQGWKEAGHALVEISPYQQP